MSSKTTRKPNAVQTVYKALHDEKSSSFGYASSLSVEDRNLYDKIWAEVRPRRGKSSALERKSNEIRNEKAREVLNSPEYSTALKTVLALQSYNLRSVNRWAFQNLEGEALKRICKLGFHTKDIPEVAARNVNFTWEIAEKFVFRNFNMSPSFKNKFFELLNPTVMTKEFFDKLASIYKEVGIEESVMALRAREVYDIDETIPDSWVMKMVQATSS